MLHKPKMPANSENMNRCCYLNCLAAREDITATLQFVAQNVPFSCCSSSAGYCHKQFPESTIVQNTTVSPNNISYLVSHYWGYYFKQMTDREIVEGLLYLRVHFDEEVRHR